MVKLNKIYTKTGDTGETGLVGTARVQKASSRIQAIGAVDEANSALGIARCSVADGAHSAMLYRIQQDLFDLGADLATLYTPEEKPSGALRISEAQVLRLEAEIDMMNATLPALTSFILPGGAQAAAYLFWARAIVRRAETALCTLASEEKISTQVLPYINRLSDHLFVMARAVNGASNEVLWKPGVNR